MGMGAKRAYVLCVAAACLCVSPLLRGAEDFSSLLNQAVAAFQQQKNAEAISLLRKAQTLNPTSKEVGEYLDKVRDNELERTRTARTDLVAMLVKSKEGATDENRELAVVVQQILNMTSALDRALVRDQEEVKKVVAELVATKDRYDEWMATFEKAKNRYGWYLAPGLVALLDHQEPGERLMAFRALATLGRDAVIPLIVAIDSPSGRVRDQIAGILARIGEPLALSSLKYLAETDKDQVVKNAALAAIGRLPNAKDVTRPAWELLAADAVIFVRGANQLPRPQYGPYVWRLEEGVLVGQEVAEFQVRRMIADLLLVRAVKATKTPELAAVAAFASNRAAQVQLYADNLALAKQQGADEARVTLLQGQAAKIHELDQSVRMLGIENMAAALVRTLQEMTEFGGAPAPAIKLINEIREFSPTAGGNAKVVAALEAALGSLEQRVRFEASVALAALNPTLTPQTGKEAVNNLTLAIANPGVRVALLISPDQDVRAYFGGLLNEAGFMPVVVDSASRGLLEASSFPPKHVILVDRNIEDITVPAAINFVRATKGAAAVPIVVISPSAKEAESRDLYQKPDNKVQVIADQIKIEGLRTSVLDAIVKDAQDTRAEGEVYAQRGAEALLSWLTVRAPYDMQGAKTGLAASVQDVNRPEGVRVPVAACLGYLADKDAMKGLAVTAATKEGGPVPVRVACIRALGETIQRLGLDAEAVAKDVASFQDAMKACLADEDEKIRVETARTIGKVAASPAVSLSLDASGK